MKYFTLSFIFLISLSLNATEITIQRRNHLGLKKFDSLQLQDKKYFFNGHLLGEKLPNHVLKSWSAIENFSFSGQKNLACTAGTFQFEKKQEKKVVLRSGCTEGKTYGELVRHLEVLRKYGAQK